MHHTFAAFLLSGVALAPLAEPAADLMKILDLPYPFVQSRCHPVLVPRWGGGSDSSSFPLVSVVVVVEDTLGGTPSFLGAPWWKVSVGPPVEARLLPGWDL